MNKNACYGRTTCAYSRLERRNHSLQKIFADDILIIRRSKEAVINVFRKFHRDAVTPTLCHKWRVQVTGPEQKNSISERAWRDKLNGHEKTVNKLKLASDLSSVQNQQGPAKRMTITWETLKAGNEDNFTPARLRLLVLFIDEKYTWCIKWII